MLWTIRNNQIILNDGRIISSLRSGANNCAQISMKLLMRLLLGYPLQVILEQIAVHRQCVKHRNTVTRGTHPLGPQHLETYIVLSCIGMYAGSWSYTFNLKFSFVATHPTFDSNYHTWMHFNVQEVESKCPASCSLFVRIDHEHVNLSSRMRATFLLTSIFFPRKFSSWDEHETLLHILVLIVLEQTGDQDN